MTNNDAPAPGPAAWRKPKRKQPEQPAAAAARAQLRQQPAAPPPASAAQGNGQQQQQWAQRGGGGGGGGGGGHPAPREHDAADEDLLAIDPRSLKQAGDALIAMSERNKRLRGGGAVHVERSRHCACTAPAFIQPLNASREKLVFKVCAFKCNVCTATARGVRGGG
jgi:hypothetical protein